MIIDKIIHSRWTILLKINNRKYMLIISKDYLNPET